MSVPRVVAVDASSPAFRAGLRPGDELVALNGRLPRDVIQYQLLVDEADLELDVRRGGLDISVRVEKGAGEPLGVEVDSALFDQVRTCDNHCEFCFIYQLPKGMRPSLYVKDDDYRLSFLYGNFTTLTRFTEADLERVVEERLSPLFVSIHATDPEVRADMLRNRRGATSLHWLRALLDHGIEAYEGFPQHENGIGIARSFEAAFLGDASRAHGARAGFFAWVDGAPAAGYRAPRSASGGPGGADAGGGELCGERPVAILTGEYGAAVIEPLLGRLAGLGRPG